MLVRPAGEAQSMLFLETSVPGDLMVVAPLLLQSKIRLDAGQDIGDRDRGEY